MMPQSTTGAVVIALAITTSLHAVDVDESWVDRLDGSAGMNDYGEAIAVAADGSVYVAGFVFEPAGSNVFAPRFMTVKYDAAGSRIWERTYAGTFASGAAAADHVAVDGNGEVVVAGSTNQGDDWAVVKYDAAGTQLWVAVYEANSTFLTEPEDMAIDGDNNIYLVGDVGDGLNPNSGNLVKLSPDGDQLWVCAYYGPTFDGASFATVVVDSSGNVYAGGSAVVPGDGSEYTLVKYDAAGNQMWSFHDGYPGSFVHDRVTALALDNDDNVIAAGYFGSNSVIGVDIALSKLDPSGADIWQRFYTGPQSDFATEVLVDSSGSVVVAGYSQIGFDDYDALTLKYDAAGMFLWEQRVSGDEIHFDWASDLAIDADDNIYTIGEYDPIGGPRYFCARYAPDGASDWFMDYAGPMGGGSGANAVAVGPGGDVYVTGQSMGVGTSLDIATIRYEQTGDSLPADVNSDGSVNVTDLLAVLADWGACGDCGTCSADLTGDCMVNVSDLLEVLANWSST